MPVLRNSLVILSLAALSGCGEKQPERVGEYDAELTQVWQSKPIGGMGSAGAVTVKEGPAPLVYLVETPAEISIVENPGDRRFQASALGRQIVSIDQARGITVGELTLASGPLPEGRRYLIQIVPPAESEARSGRITTEMHKVEPKKPTTAPTTETPSSDTPKESSNREVLP